MSALGTQISNAWSQFLDLLTKIVVPDWGALVALLPVFVVGPVVLFLLLESGLWARFQLTRRRPKVRVEDSLARQAQLDADGRPVFPPGVPYCRRDALIYPPGAIRCAVCGDELGVECPMCRVGRLAAISTCGNCGLVLKIEPKARFLQPAGPPPGGAAAA